MNAPFIIAINSLDLFLDEDDGFFSSNKTKRNNNITGVLIYNNFGLGDIQNPKYWFIENQNAKYTLDLY